jgi:hypothetical protein
MAMTSGLEKSIHCHKSHKEQIIFRNVKMCLVILKNNYRKYVFPMQ